MIGWPTRANTAAMHSEAISARPAERPSRPSITLNALVTPTSHTTESGSRPDAEMNLDVEQMHDVGQSDAGRDSERGCR